MASERDAKVETVRSELYRLIRCLMKGEVQAERFRFEMQRMDVPITEEMDVMLSRQKTGSSSAKFVDFVRASRINELDFRFASDGPAPASIQLPSSPAPKQSDARPAYSYSDRPCLGL
mmetsp:Transcript_30408/g.85106  ORF Transcript_30408/g.85106 Transcript_30408/m.85106 type:complete len:118 (+) Transcript_30408:274-627(+)